jgi:N-acylneuraminate cytidylyltransferase
MENRLGVLGLILARGGSKSVPRKSIALCDGKPLIYYTIKAAKQSRLLSRLVISTDDEEIASVAREYGVEVPFMRPRELAEDLTPDLPVFQHALGWLKDHEGYVPKAAVHLRPTTPLKATADIDKGISLLLENPNAESVRSICEPMNPPFKMYRLNEGEKFLKPILTTEYPEVFAKYKEPYNLPRQLLPKVWRHSGYVDVIRPEIITEKNSMSGTKILPLFFEEWRDIDIDSLKELKYAEEIIRSIRERGKEVWEA